MDAYKNYIARYGDFSHILNIFVNEELSEYEKISGYEKIPKYIKEFFYDLKKSSENINTKNNTIKIINDEELFLEEIKIYLKDYVNSFMNNEINANNDF